MEDIFGLKVIDTSKGSATTSCMAAGNGASANNAICNRTDCPSYGKWWCPFTGW